MVNMVSHGGKSEQEIRAGAAVRVKRPAQWQRSQSTICILLLARRIITVARPNEPSSVPNEAKYSLLVLSMARNQCNQQAEHG